MKKLILSLLTSLMLLFSFASCSPYGYIHSSQSKNETVEIYTVAEAVDSDYVSYEEILIDNNITDTPILFFTSEATSYAREILTEQDEAEKKAFKSKKQKNEKSDDTEKPRYLVEKRTLGFDDDVVKDMEITFYLPTDKYSEKDMKEMGKEYEDISFAEVVYKKGERTHIVTITFADLEYPENVSKLKKTTDLVVTKGKHVSFKLTNRYLKEKGFSKKF